MRRLVVLVGMILVVAFLFGCTMDDLGKALKEVQDVAEDSMDDNDTEAQDNGEEIDDNDTEAQDNEEEMGEDRTEEESSVNEDLDAGLLRIEDYYPIRENTRYIYEGEGNEYAPYESYVDYVEGDRAQLRIENSGTILARIIEVKDGKVTLLSTIPEANHRENHLGTEDQVKEVLLMEPLVEGTSWILEDGSGSVRKITGTAVDVETPAGDFEAIEVFTEGEGNKIYDYYVKDIGLVKSVFMVDEIDDNQVVSILREVQEDTVLSIDVRFYYPDVDNNQISFESRELKFRTNDNTNDAFEDVYKDMSNNGFPVVFTENTKINILNVDEDGIAHLDLNRSFVDETEGGARYEGMLLESIAKTFGHYCDVQRLALTIDGGIYQTESILLEQGDYIDVDQ